MDFSKTLENAKGFSDDPQEAWVNIATSALQLTETEFRMTGNSDTKHSIVTQLRDFLYEIAKSLDVIPPSSLNSGHYDARLRNLQEYAGRQKSKMLAKKIANQVGASEGFKLQYIEVSNSGLVKIHSLLGELRRSVDTLDLPKKKKKALNSKLDGFERQLVSRAVSPTQVFAVLAIVGAAAAGTTSTLADGPDAIETIGKITAHLGLEKQNQDDAASIAAELETKFLPGPKTNEIEQSDGSGPQ